MYFNSSYLLLVVCFVSNYSYGQKEDKFFRKDYQYIEASQSFYKIHTLPRTWLEAKRACVIEGASLFYPENSTRETQAVLNFWNHTQPIQWMFVGISALVVQGVFETVDGKGVSEIYNDWIPGQPDDAAGIEDCVIMRKDGKLNNVPCSNKYSFICIKTLSSLKWNVECAMSNLDYRPYSKSGKCFKFHTKPMRWPDAYAVCRAELSYLAVINSANEAEFYVKLIEKGPWDQVSENFTREAVHLGFHKITGDGWQTAIGTTLEDSGYAVWASGQPDGGDRELCGAMSLTGQLHDIECGQKAFFICEHESESLLWLRDNRKWAGNRKH